MITFPNAKINLGLNILSKRADGYHNIETIFYPIALQDALEIVPSKEIKKYRLFQTGLDMQTHAEDNLVVKALHLMAEQKYIPNIDIHLYKKIPHGAGLGGGSSNAASMLLLLNKTFSLGYSEEELKQFAIQLGADCSFFLKNRTSFASGIGDQLQVIDLSLEGYYFVLIKPDITVSTKEAYQEIIPNVPVLSLKEIIKLPIIEWRNTMFNDFETPVFRKHPEIKEIKETLYTQGALYASMTGSGSALYGFFEKKPEILFPDCFVWKNYV